MSVAIATQGLTRDFKTVRAVDEVTLTVPSGTIFGFLGPNGAGKTTTIHLLLGLIRPSRGSAQVLGFDVATQAAEIRNHTGALLEHHGLYERLTAHQNLDFFARAYRLSEADRKERVEQALRDLELWDRRREPVAKWSRGMKQKLAIARTMLHRPPLIFLDEPTAGHDPASAHDLRELLVGIAKRDGVTVFLTTHNLNEAERVCSRVAILQRGRVIAEGRPQDLRSRAGKHEVEIEGKKITPKIAAGLRTRRNVLGVELADGVLRVELAGTDSVGPIVRYLVEAGVDVEEVRRGKASLEDAYLTLVKEKRP